MPYNDLREKWPEFRKSLKAQFKTYDVTVKSVRQTVIQSDEVMNLTIDFETLNPEQIYNKYGI